MVGLASGGLVEADASSGVSWEWMTCYASWLAKVDKTEKRAIMMTSQVTCTQSRSYHHGNDNKQRQSMECWSVIGDARGCLDKSDRPVDHINGAVDETKRRQWQGGGQDRGKMAFHLTLGRTKTHLMCACVGAVCCRT